MSGNDMLILFDRLARRLRLNHIIIGTDASQIIQHKCSKGNHKLAINLAILSILATGQSWYNRYGYKQTGIKDGELETSDLDNTELYNIQTAANSAILSQPIDQFFVSHGLSTYGIDTDVLPTDKHTVQSYFVEIQQQMKIDAYDCHQYTIISKVISDIFEQNMNRLRGVRRDSVILYDYDNLVRRVEYTSPPHDLIELTHTRLRPHLEHSNISEEAIILQVFGPTPKSKTKYDNYRINSRDFQEYGITGTMWSIGFSAHRFHIDFIIPSGPGPILLWDLKEKTGIAVDKSLHDRLLIVADSIGREVDYSVANAAIHAIRRIFATVHNTPRVSPAKPLYEFQLSVFSITEGDDDSGNLNAYLEVGINVKDADRTLCTRFVVDTQYNHIVLTRLQKCTLGGNVISDKLERVAIEANIRYIVIETDESSLVFEHCRPIEYINLAIFNILTFGESWYNRYGYRQTEWTSDELYDYENDELYLRETAQNEGVVESNIVEFLEGHQLLDTGIHTVLPPKKQSVRQYFKRLYDGLKRGEYKCPKIKIIAALVRAIAKKDIIQYSNQNLIKRVGIQRLSAMSKDIRDMPDKMRILEGSRSTKSLPTRLTGKVPSKGTLRQWQQTLHRRHTRRSNHSEDAALRSSSLGGNGRISRGHRKR